MTRGEWKIAFGDNLAALLREKGISQNQLSRDSGISKGMISDYVNKFAAPNVFAIINMAHALDVDVNDLVDFGDTINE